MTMISDFAKRVAKIIASIPAGRVATYGQIAVLAGNPRGARQVSRFLHSMSGKYDLPWQRVVNSRGTISLPDSAGDHQRALLAAEGVEFDLKGRIDLERFQFRYSGEV
ncbi:MAG: MGMT family protein [Spirochaetales bacterium]|nr:MGMT family protein [Spirochaetales bacterium]